MLELGRLKKTVRKNNRSKQGHEEFKNCKLRWSKIETNEEGKFMWMITQTDLLNHVLSSSLDKFYVSTSSIHLNLLQNIP